MLRHPIFENKTKIPSKQAGEELFNMLDKTFQIPSEYAFQIVEVTSDFIARPDLISRLYYNTEIYTDILCKLNGISNPFELNEGMRLVIPEQYELYKFYYNESASELDSSTTQSNTPVAKNKTDKRKPNEAVVGDKRYKVDSTKKVIVY